MSQDPNLRVLLPGLESSPAFRGLWLLWAERGGVWPGGGIEMLQEPSCLADVCPPDVYRAPIRPRGCGGQQTGRESTLTAYSGR